MEDLNIRLEDIEEEPEDIARQVDNGDDNGANPNAIEIEQINLRLIDLKRAMYSKILEQHDMKEQFATGVIPYCLFHTRVALSNAELDDSEGNIFEPECPPAAPYDEYNAPPALRNDLILDIIGSYLAMPDLRNARLVSKHWSDAFHRSIVKRKPLMISSPHNAAADILVERKRMGENIHISTLVIINTSLATPIVRNVVESFGASISGIILDDCYPSPHLMSWLMNSMTSLEYVDFRTTDQDLSPDTSGSLLDHVLHSTPQLIFRTVKVLNWEDVRAIKSLVFLSVRFPSLRTLKLTFCDNGGSGLYQYGAKPWRSLLDLHLTAPTKGALSPIIVAFGKMRPRLRKFRVYNVGKSVRDLRAIATFVNNSCAQNLKVLAINKRDDLIQTASPILNRMFHGDFSELEFIKYDFSLSEMIRVAQDLAPKLTSIDASNCSIQCWFDFFCGVTRERVSAKQNTSVVTLHLGYTETMCLRKFGQIFPNLTTLDVPRTELGEDAMRVIFKSYPNLQNLRIRKCIKEIVATSFDKAEINDSTMLGIDQSTLQELIESKKPITSEKLKELRTHPYIGDLKELQSFKIDTVGFYHPSDLFLEHGILSLPKLLTLVLPFTASAETAESRLSQIKRILKNRNPDVFMETTRNGEKFMKSLWPSHGEDDCKRRALEILKNIY